MQSKTIGDPCPSCRAPLMRRRSTFRTVPGDVAYCARCDASFELAAADEENALGLDAEFAPT